MDLGQAKRAESGSSMQLSQQVVSAGPGRPFFDDQVVQCPVVHAHPQRLVSLGSKEDGCATGRLTLLFAALAQEFLDSLFHPAIFPRTQSVRAPGRRFVTRL